MTIHRSAPHTPHSAEIASIPASVMYSTALVRATCDSTGGVGGGGGGGGGGGVGGVVGGGGGGGVMSHGHSSYIGTKSGSDRVGGHFCGVIHEMKERVSEPPAHLRRATGYGRRKEAELLLGP